jgi:hypothetical protein
MCTQQHTHAVQIAKYTEPKNQSHKLTKPYALGHKQYGTSNINSQNCTSQQLFKAVL